MALLALPSGFFVVALSPTLTLRPNPSETCRVTQCDLSLMSPAPSFSDWALKGVFWRAVLKMSGPLNIAQKRLVSAWPKSPRSSRQLWFCRNAYAAILEEARSVDNQCSTFVPAIHLS